MLSRDESAHSRCWLTSCLKSECAYLCFRIFFLSFFVFPECLRIALGVTGFIFDITYWCFDTALEHLLWAVAKFSTQWWNTYFFLLQCLYCGLYKIYGSLNCLLWGFSVLVSKGNRRYSHLLATLTSSKKKVFDYSTSQFISLFPLPLISEDIIC